MDNKQGSDRFMNDTEYREAVKKRAASSIGFISTGNMVSANYGGHPPNDVADRIAIAIFEDLCDRRGIKHELTGVDDDIQEEIADVAAEIARQCIAQANTYEQIQVVEQPTSILQDPWKEGKPFTPEVVWVDGEQKTQLLIIIPRLKFALMFLTTSSIALSSGVKNPAHIALPSAALKQSTMWFRC